MCALCFCVPQATAILKAARAGREQLKLSPEEVQQRKRAEKAQLEALDRATEKDADFDPFGRPGAGAAPGTAPRRLGARASCDLRPAAVTRQAP